MLRKIAYYATEQQRNTLSRSLFSLPRNALSLTDKPWSASRLYATRTSGSLLHPSEEEEMAGAVKTAANTEDAQVSADKQAIDADNQRETFNPKVDLAETMQRENTMEALGTVDSTTESNNNIRDNDPLAMSEDNESPAIVKAQNIPKEKTGRVKPRFQTRDGKKAIRYGVMKKTLAPDVTIKRKSSLAAKIRRTAAQRHSEWKLIPNQYYTRVFHATEGRVPRLAHNLDRVLFNPGVHYMKDPRTNHYNFTYLLEDITQPADFDYSALNPYTSPSQDKELIQLARNNSRRYVGSTSSVSSSLAQFYFTLSKFKPVDISCLSTVFSNEATNFTRGCRAPASIILRWNNGVYAIDSDKSLGVDETDKDSDNTILSNLGRSMEKMLTLEPDLYSQYLKANTLDMTPDDKDQPDAFAYGSIDEFLFRSQLDCQDERLPRRVFDLKTRAVLPIRLDQDNYAIYTGYTLKRLHGLFESFEREYYDMIRAAFLKYSFQVRIGHMDGIMVTYHNTSKVFGFQYISREEMDARLFGTSKMGDESFRYAILLMGKVLDAATRKYPQQSLRLSFEARQDRWTPDTYMDIFVEPSLNNGNKGHLQEDESGIAFFQTKEMDPAASDDMAFFCLTTKSFVNGKLVDGPVELNHADDHWQLKYRLHEAKLDVSEIRQRYKDLRRRQALAFCTAGSNIPFLKQFIDS